MNDCMPHHRLIAYQRALELVRLIARVRIGEARCREQARKSAVSCALNAAEVAPGKAWEEEA